MAVSAAPVTIPTESVIPDRALVLQHQGLPATVDVPSHIADLHATAVDLFRRAARSRGLVAQITVSEFAQVYIGEGNNESSGPVADIFPRAEYLALFAVTVGEEVSAVIADGFAANDFALASMLDGVASEAADAAAEFVERQFERQLRARGWAPPDGGVLRYSPGYCGWHVTGQRRLFAALKPERIGIALTESCLMQPLKSVSGVLVAGPESTHTFPPSYPVCAACETFACRNRLRALRTRQQEQERGTA
jgi:hypothetical protein